MSATQQQQGAAASAGMASAAAQPQQPAAVGGPAAGPPQPPQQPQQAATPAAVQAAVEAPPPAQPAAPRFEDLTIDDDLPLLPRLQRYVRSSIALQRLVHVRMLGDAALEVGRQLTATELVPLLPPLVRDGEGIIRQRLCTEIKVLCLVLMGMTRTTEAPPTQPGITSLPQVPKPEKTSKYYKVMVHHLFPHLYTLISDPDNEVRRAASENIVKLALRVDKDDVVTLALSIPLRLVKEGQKRASNPDSATSGADAKGNAANPQTPAEDLLITASNLLADLASFLPPTRLPPETTTRYLSPTVLSLAEDPNFRVRRAAVQALPRMLGSATLDDVKRRLLPRFVALSGDEMYRVRKASGECLVDVSRALAVLPWRVHFGDVWIEHDIPSNGKGSSGQLNAMDNGHVASDIERVDVPNRLFYRPRTQQQIEELDNTIKECHEIRRRALCAVAKKLLEDGNKFVRYGMMQFLGPLIASFYPLDRGSMMGGMGGLLYCGIERAGGNMDGHTSGTLGIGVECVSIAKGSTGLDRLAVPSKGYDGERYMNRVEDVMSYNHSLHGLELILHGESPMSHSILEYGGGCNADKDPFGTMGPQFFPHANGMVGRSSALDDDDTDSFLLSANYKRYNKPQPKPGVVGQSPRAMLPKFILESRSDSLALARIVRHRAGLIPTNDDNVQLPHPPLMSGRPDLEDLKAISTSLLIPFIAMASCRTGEETTDAEMRVYCAYSLPAVVLLFGGRGWKGEGLRRCFLDLIGSSSELDGDNEGPGVDNAAGAPAGPPLPVKRCLASSVHAVAHMLGPDIASSDQAFLATFDKAFLRDPDEAIRLNILKNLASFLVSLPAGDGPGRRNTYLPVLHSIIMGDDVLGASKRRSASNPGVLNWRQRDAVARALPDLIVLFDADLNREFIWPILKALLTDTVSAVREDAGWSVPVLLRKYTSCDENEAEAWMSEVTSWLKETFLGEEGGTDAVMTSPTRLNSRRLKRQQTVMSEGAFSRRQGYCRILAAVALAMRMGEGEGGNPSSGSSNDDTSGMPPVPVDPFGAMSEYERDIFRSILLRDLLPPALEMAVDCVANVRLTLTKCLKALPPDIRSEGHVTEVLATLEEELTTWDVGDLPLDGMGPGGSGVVATASGPMSDPPEAKAAAAGSAPGPSGSVVMTSTMSAC